MEFTISHPVDNEDFIFCAKHPSKMCLLWCKNCNVMLCMSCMEDEHDGHSVRQLRKHLVEKIESISEKRVHQVILENSEVLAKLIHSKQSELETLKLRVLAAETGLAQAQKLMNKLEKCVSNTSTVVVDAEDAENDLSLLLNLAEGSLQKKALSYFCDSSETKMQSKLTQTETHQVSVHCSAQPTSSSFAAQTQNEIHSKPTQTEVSSNCKSTQTATIDKTSFLFKNSRDLSPPSDLLSCRSSLTGSQVHTEPELAQPSTCYEAGMADCGCLIRHRWDPPTDFPIAIIGLLRVQQRKPLIIDNSNDLILCPFQFWISAQVVPHKDKENVQMVRFEINCCHVYDDDDRLPPAHFRYGFTLNNNSKNEPDREKEGYWNCAKHKRMFWYPISVSELLNRRKGWIDRDNDIVVTLELRLNAVESFLNY